MDARVVEAIPTLTAAVETIMNPVASQIERQTAHQVCDNFKEKSEVCIPCGLVLAQKQNTPVVRHFGLQLLEHSIKFRWDGLSQDEKDALKKQSVELISNGTGSILEEHCYIKDAASRVAVEIIKREWPQLWPSLLQDLYSLCQIGEVQTEIVLKIFLRLVEDVVTFQVVPTQRRREILQALTSHVGELFEFFVTLLQEHTSKASNDLLKSGQPEEVEGAMAHCRVSQAVLLTLSGFLDWVNMTVIMVKNGLLLQILCLLLSNSNLQLYSAECLLIIVSRKGKLEDRKPLLILFSEDAMSIIWTAAVAAEQASKDEYYYLFLKRLCQVLIEIGKQLCALWGSAPDVGQPANFSKYLEALLAFTQHPSQMLGSFTQTLWACFLRHESISKEPTFLSFIPRVVETATKTLLRIGFLTQSNSPSCDYARLDFDSDEEFKMFFSKYRAEIAETLRLATLLSPKVTFGFAARWLTSVLEKPIDLGDVTLENGICNQSSPSFLEWDALTVCLESVMTKLMISAEDKPDFQDGIVLFEKVLSYETQDPMILSCLLSSLSALFPFLNYTPDTLPRVLEKIFFAVIFNIPGQTKATRSRAVKNVRQHACSVLVKICKQYPALLLPVFDKLYNHIQTISSDPDQLSQMEKCILIEALILVSNQFRDFDKQSLFVEEVLKPVKELWLSEEFKEAFWCPAKFMSYVGLDKPAVEPSSADTCGIHRSHITYCIHTILAVMKRTKWPEDLQAGTSGGFQFGNYDSGNPILKNPATRHIIIMLENLFGLFKTMNALWLPENLQLRHPDFANSYDLLDVEKLAVLGIPPPCVDNSSSPACKQPYERMQNFITTTHDMGCHILGNAGQCLGYEFYTVPNLSQLLLESLFTNLDNLPDYRLRPVIRAFMKPFIQNCPKECQASAVIPVLAFLCPYMMQRLVARWQQIHQRFLLSNENEEDNPESQEVLEDQLTRQLTREYIELLVAVCVSRSGRMDEPSDKMEDEGATGTQTRDYSLSELGLLVIRTEAMFPSVVICVFTALSWNDTLTCHKCISLCWSLVKQLHAENKMTPEACHHFFHAALSGLQLHGQHDACQAMLLSLGLQMYELLRPQFPDISQVLLQIPDCTPQKVKAFDDKLLVSSPQKQMPEKKKKEAFKKLVSEIIGKNIGQQFRREVHYKSLPPLFRIKPKPPSLDEIESKDMGLCELFKPTNGN